MSRRLEYFPINIDDIALPKRFPEVFYVTARIILVAKFRDVNLTLKLNKIDKNMHIVNNLIWFGRIHFEIHAICCLYTRNVILLWKHLINMHGLLFTHVNEIQIKTKSVSETIFRQHFAVKLWERAFYIHINAYMQYT